MRVPYGVVYLSSIDWSFRTQDHQFTCLELARRGHRVVYVENTGVRLPGARDLRRVAARVRNVVRRAPMQASAGGVKVVSPVVIPGAESQFERFLNRRLFRAQLSTASRWLGGAPMVLWVGLPNWAALDLAAILRPALLVYYCGDAFREVPGVRRGLVESESALIRRADLVFANSLALLAYCRSTGASDARFVPIGVDLSISARVRAAAPPAPPELASAQGRIIGYMGGLNHKLDIELLDAVARAHPGDTLAVLGGIEDREHVPTAPNVLMIGERPYEEIGRYIFHFDVGLVPYVVNEFTASVYPGKLVEYLAHGRPVVSTPLPEVMPYRDVVRIEASRAGFINAVSEALATPDTPEIMARRIAAVQKNGYEAVVGEMISAVDARMAMSRQG